MTGMAAAPSAKSKYTRTAVSGSHPALLRRVTGRQDFH